MARLQAKVQALEKQLSLSAVGRQRSLQLSSLSSAAAVSLAGSADDSQAADQAGCPEHLVTMQAHVAELEEALAALRAERNGAAAASAATAAAAQAQADRLAAQLAAKAEEAEAVRAQLHTVQQDFEHAAAAHAQQVGDLRAQLAVAAKEAASAVADLQAVREQHLAHQQLAQQQRTTHEAQQHAAREQGGAATLQCHASPASSVGSGLTADVEALRRGRAGLQAALDGACTTCYTVVLDSPCGAEAELRQRCEALQDEVAQLRDMQAQLLSQAQALLAAKDVAERGRAAAAAELALLRRTHELLEEQAVRLQQEVSAYQAREVVEGGSSEQAPLDRSPSRTLTSRLAELVHRASPRSASTDRGRPPSASSASSMRNPPSPQRVRAGGGGSKGDSPAAPVDPAQGLAAARVQAELASARAADLEVQLGEARGQAAAAEAVAADLREKLATSQTALGDAAARFEATSAALRERAVMAETAADKVLSLHAAAVDITQSPGRLCASLGGGSPGNSAAAGAPDHARCRQLIEGLHATAWRERLARQRIEAEAMEPRAGAGGSARAGSPPPSSRRASAVLQAPGSVAPSSNPSSSAGRSSSASRSSSSSAAGGGDSGGVAAANADAAEEALLRSELASLDAAATELPGLRRRQKDLGRRVEACEQRMAGWDALLEAAAAVSVVPPVAHVPGSGGSPKRSAITSLQMRRLAEENSGLAERVQALEGEVAAARRRERDREARARALLGQHEREKEALASRWREEAAARQSAEGRLRASARATAGLVEGAALGGAVGAAARSPPPATRAGLQLTAHSLSAPCALHRRRHAVPGAAARGHRRRPGPRRRAGGGHGPDQRAAAAGRAGPGRRAGLPADERGSAGGRG